MTNWIRREHVAISVKANNWQEAIQASGNLLLHTGAITEDYIFQMIQSVKENGPYIVIGPGIAMAHARPSEAVREDAISLAVLERSVSFGSEENDPLTSYSLSPQKDLIHTSSSLNNSRTYY